MVLELLSLNSINLSYTGGLREGVSSSINSGYAGGSKEGTLVL